MLRCKASHAVFFAVLAAIILPLGADIQNRSDACEPLLRRLESSFVGRDRTSYLANFSSTMRDAEKETFGFYADGLGLKRMELRVSGASLGEGGLLTLFVQAHLTGDMSVYTEFWIMTLAEGGGGLSVVGRTTVGSLGPLYNLSVPSGGAVRADRIEIVHKDIRITFGKASVFRDNLPGKGTMLVIVGRGTVLFSPSDENEKRQMRLLYGKDELEAGLRSLYLRCSPGLLASNVKIKRASGAEIPGAPDFEAAARVFKRNYSRSFTVESPANGEVLSFLPQGEETVIEMDVDRIGELAYIYSPFADEEVNLYDRKKKRVISLYNPVEGDGPARTGRMFVRHGNKFDVESYDLSVDYRPAQAALSARAGIHIRSNADNLANVRLRFNPELRIDSISDDQGRRLFYTLDRDRALLYVYFNKPVNYSGTGLIDVVYSGRIIPPLPLTDNMGQTGPGDMGLFHPRYDNYLFTLGGLWYPAPDEDDFYPCRLKISVPEAYSCVAVGAPEAGGPGEPMFPDEEYTGSGQGTFRFSTDRPVKYISFIIGRFDLIKRSAGPLPLELHVSRELMDRKPQVFDQARAIVDSYSRAFGPYPFEKLGVVLRSWPVSGGFSPPSYVVLNEVPWHAERGGADLSEAPVTLPRYSDFFLAHEIAHQWWGQGVSFATYRDQWLSEGLAQYSAVSFIREKYGQDAWLSAVRKFSKWVNKKTYRGPVTMGARLSAYDHDAYQAIIYDKPALILFMLEDLVGRDSVQAGLRNFFAANRGRAARTRDFIKAMENSSGRELGGFFGKWLYSSELPSVRSSWSEEKTCDGYTLKLKIFQSGEGFEFPLVVQWSEEQVERRESVRVEGTVQEFTWHAGSKPSKFKVNPDGLVPGGFN